MRDPIVQCDEELTYYNEIFDFVIETLQKLPYEGIITEGAAYLPKRMKALQVPNHHYLALTPSKDFQLYHYGQREWVSYVLSECKDPNQAFSNWMERDHLFSKSIQKQCHDINYLSLINDGNHGIDDLLTFVINHFKLGDE